MPNKRVFTLANIKTTDTPETIPFKKDGTQLFSSSLSTRKIKGCSTCSREGEGKKPAGGALSSLIVSTIFTVENNI
jgi:hypothetical protein